MADNEPDADEDEVPDENEMPELLEEICQQIGIHVPEHLSKDERPLYARMLNRQCVTCGAALGSRSMLVVNALGVVMVFCGGACYTDMQVQGWLQETYDDIVDKIKFRGGAADG